MITIKKGLDLQIAGEPEQTIHQSAPAASVALLGADYAGIRPSLEVGEGDHVKLGQVLFTDKRTPGIRYTSPGCGRVAAIHRGEKRAFLSIEIALAGNEEETFAAYLAEDLDRLTDDQVRENLVRSGLWTALRTRPFSRVPPVDSVPHAIFVTAMDTQPLAARAEAVIEESEGSAADFLQGLAVLRHLTDGTVFVCRAPETLPRLNEVGQVEVRDFAGPHPAGLPGTHIHFLDPVHLNKTVWHIGYQDVMAVGKLFVTGRLPVERVVALGGPVVQRPRLLRTRLGANLTRLVEGELGAGPVRVLSGSVLSGRTSEPPGDFLGRYHLQVSALADQCGRDLFGWVNPLARKFSVKRVFYTALFGRDRKLPLTTCLEGSPRPMVPIGSYERVMPLDIEPVYLLRSLIVGNTEKAVSLGCLELDEDDLALCTCVCPSKIEYGPILRRNLTTIEAEG